MKIMPTVTQGIPAAQAFHSIGKVQKPQVGTLADPAANAPGQAATGGGAQSLPGEIDLQAFFAAWGTDNEQFDVTKDGTVDGEDLAVFLGSAQQSLGKSANPDQVVASWGQPNGAGDLNGDGTVDGFDLALSLGAVTQSKETTLAEGVQKAWGTTETAYDLNGDGTVDGLDLAIALGGKGPQQPLQAGADATPASSNANAVDADVEAVTQASTGAPEDQAASAAAKLTDAVLQVKDANGDGELAANELGASAAYLKEADLNATGSLSREELQAKLTNELSTAATRTNADLSAVTAKWAQALLRSDTTAIRARNAYGVSGGRTDAGAGAIADRLYDRLAKSGFDRTPPSNLMKLVQGLGMRDGERSQVLRGLAQKYPNGLGVSAKA